MTYVRVYGSPNNASTDPAELPPSSADRVSAYDTRARECSTISPKPKKKVTDPASGITLFGYVDEACVNRKLALATPAGNWNI